MTDPTFISNRIAELPVCFRDDQGIAWASGTGAVQDQEVTLLRTAALSRFPQFCPDDALDLAGTWMAIPRLPGEADGTIATGYRGRLCAAFPTWINAGSKQGIIDSLEAAGFAGVVVRNKHEYDPGAEWWSMFEVQIDAAASVPPIELGTWDPAGDGDVWDAPGTWDSGTTPQQYLQIIQQILRWKWSYSIPEYLLIDFGGGTVLTVPLVNKWGDPQMIWGEFVWGNAPLLPGT